MASTDPETVRCESFYLAQLADKTRRYDDMVAYVDQILSAASSLGGRPSADERHLLSVAYKHAYASRRATWRNVALFLRRVLPDTWASRRAAALLGCYKEHLEREMERLCSCVLRFSETLLADPSESPEEEVFLRKLEGDYHRYLAEFKQGEERNREVEMSLDSYSRAEALAFNELSPLNPVRLGLALNFAVFYYEILEDHDKAISMSEEAFDAAIVLMDSLSEHNFKDCSVIMRLLRDNITLWKSKSYYGRLCACECRPETNRAPKKEVAAAEEAQNSAIAG